MTRPVRTVAEPITCADCGRLVGPTHFRPSGPYCRARQSPVWTPARRWKLAELTDRGWADETIAAALTRAWGRTVTVRAVVTARSRYGLSGADQAWLSAERIARMLGLADGEPVARWVRNGWLCARQGRRTGRGHAWLVSHRALWDFVADPRFWPFWSPDAVTDAALRRHVAEVRGAPVYVRVADAPAWLGARGLFVSLGTVQHWLRTGHLPSIALPLAGEPTPREVAVWRLIPVAALDAVEPPAMGGDRRTDRRAA